MIADGRETHALFVYREEIFVMLSLSNTFKNSWTPNDSIDVIKDCSS